MPSGGNVIFSGKYYKTSLCQIELNDLINLIMSMCGLTRFILIKSRVDALVTSVISSVISSVKSK